MKGYGYKTTRPVLYRSPIKTRARLYAMYRTKQFAGQPFPPIYKCFPCAPARARNKSSTQALAFPSFNLPSISYLSRYIP